MTIEHKGKLLDYTQGDHVRVADVGVAFWFVRYAERCVVDYWDPLDNTYVTDFDTAVVRAVGDDVDREVPTDDIRHLEEDEFCGGCGQIGCGHG